MIHYINNVPAKNIQLQKAKSHALANYRKNKSLALIKDTAVRFAIVAVAGTVLAAVYLLAN